MPDDLSVAIAAYRAAAWPVLADPDVWKQEQLRTDAAPLAWPLAVREHTNFRRLLVNLANVDVELSIGILRDHGDTRAPDWPPRADDPKLQVLLRVAYRALQAGEQAMVAAFGGERVTGKREFLNRETEQAVEMALRLARQHNLTRDEAFELLGLPRRKAFRAARRTTKRK